MNDLGVINQIEVYGPSTPISMDEILGFPHDHADIAWSHFLAQHVNKSNTENFVKAFYQPFNVLDKALNDLYTKRWLDIAEGVQLDGIGSIVGITREVPNSVYLPFFGFTSQPSGRGFGEARMRRRREPYATSNFLGDEDYRIALHSKIALNNGHGTAEELMYAVNTALRVTGTRVLDVGNGNARIYINDFILPNDPRYSILLDNLAKAGGVKLWPYFVDVDFTFGFLNQQIYYGFGIGILARSPGSNIPSIVIIMSIWDRGESIWDVGNSVWDLRGTEGAPFE
jgi:hypothetical protein